MVNQVNARPSNQYCVTCAPSEQFPQGDIVNMNPFTRGLTVSAISLAALFAVAGCSSREEKVTSVEPPPQVVVEPAPVVVSPPPRTVTEQTTTQRSVNDSVDN